MNFSRHQFSHDFETLSYVAEASDLSQGTVAMVLPTTLVIDGFEFDYFRTDRDEDEGDVVCWEYKPTSKTLARRAAFAGYTVRIYND